MNRTLAQSTIYAAFAAIGLVALTSASTAGCVLASFFEQAASISAPVKDNPRKE